MAEPFELSVCCLLHVGAATLSTATSCLSELMTSPCLTTGTAFGRHARAVQPPGCGGGPGGTQGGAGALDAGLGDAEVQYWRAQRGSKGSDHSRRSLRRHCHRLPQEEEPWFGFEQEYTLFGPDRRRPLGWPAVGVPEAQIRYWNYCGLGGEVRRQQGVGSVAWLHAVGDLACATRVTPRARPHSVASLCAGGGPGGDGRAHACVHVRRTVRVGLQPGGACGRMVALRL
jgi:hypothetical protein